MLCQKGAIQCAICFTHVSLFLTFAPTLSIVCVSFSQFQRRFYCIACLYSVSHCLPSLHIPLRRIIQGNEQPTFTSLCWRTHFDSAYRARILNVSTLLRRPNQVSSSFDTLTYCIMRALSQR